MTACSLKPLRYPITRAALSLACGLALLLTGCGDGGSSSPSYGSSGIVVAAASIPGDNVLPLRVDSGPAGAGPQANRLYADVTLCQPPGTSNCQTIQNVLVDTGSTGLRLIASAVSTGLNLQPRTSPTTLACQQFLDGSFAWGPVVSADVQLGGKKISNLPVQLIGDTANQATSATCSTNGNSITSVVDVGLNKGLGATGILGVGTSKEDCGAGCEKFANKGYYFTCSGSGCSGTTVPVIHQLQNPVHGLPADNNGVTVVLPTVPAGALSAKSLSGSLVFGIGTRANNITTGASAMQLMPTQKYGFVISSSVARSPYAATMANSFLDTGANGLYFGKSPALPLPRCSTATDFYCPATRETFSATLTGNSGSPRNLFFDVDPAAGSGAVVLFNTGDPVLPTLSGPTGDASQFVWGLPFFYGRKVFIGFEGQTGVFNGTTVAGPFYAF